MKREPVKSSAIAEIGYDAEKQILEVMFHSGGLYQYAGFDQKAYEWLRLQSSIGSHFAKEIAGKYPVTKMPQEAQDAPNPERQANPQTGS
jgi:hypothetical protein